METTKTVQELATEARSYFVTLTRDNGDVVWVTKDGRPDWVQEMIHAAHCDMLPDDWRYSFIVEALDALSEYDDEDYARSSIEADMYTSNLTAWLHSRNDRIEYCNQVLEDYSMKDMTGIIQHGQLYEKNEVFDEVSSFLQRMVEEEDN